MKIARHIEQKNDKGFNFGPFSCSLGDRQTARHTYECRIMDKETGKHDRVLVYASNFGEVKWCMMGYTKRVFIIIDTTLPNVKHLVYPDDVGEKRFVIFVIRNK